MQSGGEACKKVFQTEHTRRVAAENLTLNCWKHLRLYLQSGLHAGIISHLFLIVAGQRAVFQAADKVVDILRINAHLPEISLNALRIGHTDLITERIHIGFHLSPRRTFMARCEKDAAKQR